MRAQARFSEPRGGRVRSLRSRPTGVTRARRLVVLVGSRQAIAMAVRNDRIASRNTRLARRLQDYTLPRDPGPYQAGG